MTQRYEAVVVGTSAGGSAVLARLLPRFPAAYPWPLIIVQHLHPLQESAAIILYNDRCALIIKEAELSERIRPGYAYFAPPNYHLLIEDDRTFALSTGARVNYMRPAIDVLFESAVDAYGPHLIGVILTGGNHDGAAGLRRIHESGGLTVVQAPETAEVAAMPRAAIAATAVDHVLPPDQIAALLVEMADVPQEAGGSDAK